MVQRKAPDKLGIQADSKNHVKSEKWSTALKPSTTSQNHETKNKGGPELKKIMKKSRSIKRSEFDSLRSNSMRRAKSRPEKPPSDVLVAAVTPQKPPPVKPPEASPNYMKSTTSSIARKERSVSPHGSKTITETRTEVIVSKPSPVPGHKPGRTLTKTSSLKPVRTLTKASSTKAGRPSMKKNSGVGLYSDQDVRKATCSSTLKDSKFPTYVALRPVATTKALHISKKALAEDAEEYETQKSFPISRKSSGKGKKDIDIGQMIFNENPTLQEEDLAGVAVSPSTGDQGLDFFVEIYAPTQDDTIKSIGRDTSDGNDEKKDFSIDPCGLENRLYPVEDSAETDLNDDGGRYAESFPDDSSHSSMNFEDNIDHYTDFIMEEMDTPVFFPEKLWKEEVENKDHLPCYTLAEIGGLADCTTQDDGSTESEIDDSISEATSLYWGRDNECYEEVSDIEDMQAVQSEINEYFDKEFDGGDQASSDELNTSRSQSPQDLLPSNEGVPENTKENVEVKVETADLIPIVFSSDAVAYALEEESEPTSGEKHGIYQAEDDTNKELNRTNEFPDLNVGDGTEEGKDYESCPEGKEQNNYNTCSDERSCSEGSNLKSIDDCSTEGVKLNAEDRAGTEKATVTNEECNLDQQCATNYSNSYKPTRNKRPVIDVKEPREFNPRGPRFLPLEPELDPETVDLRHQMMDERRNAEEWMVDYALRKAVSKLAPARKRKVALLVEAFETVLPIPQYEIHLEHSRTGFTHTRFMQACS
ncbi:hypothetical protein IFM89_037585 [Coptis chinensis]|uniref:Calmodulin-binding domain-containing protein n=1 Tax=Coptis chinensis TaxID=261450 RepID=A0A835H8C3_9MAGN|nr:hypothetical protein IFM89_037585 [Coptis chinensis]